jgi:hypothetical protein
MTTLFVFLLYTIQSGQETGELVKPILQHEGSPVASRSRLARMARLANVTGPHIIRIFKG